MFYIDIFVLYRFNFRNEGDNFLLFVKGGRAVEINDGGEGLGI